MQLTENTTLRTVVIVLVVGLVIAGWTLFFRGQQTSARVIFALVSTVTALTLWVFHFRQKEKAAQGKDER